MQEEKYFRLLKEVAATLPTFADGRIDYTHATTAVALTAFVMYGDLLLFLKRSERVGNYKGKWDVVGGYLDEIRPIEEKVFEELREELGIAMGQVEEIKIGEEQEYRDQKTGKIWILFPVLVSLTEMPTIELDWEHTEYAWISPDQIDQYDALPDLSKTFRHLRALA